MKTVVSELSHQDADITQSCRSAKAPHAWAFPTGMGRGLLAGMPYGVAAGILLLPPFWPFFIYGLPAAILLGGRAYQQYRRCARQPDAKTILTLMSLENEQFLLGLGNGACRVARLHPASFVHARLLALRFTAEDGGVYRLLLPCARRDRAALRGLRIHLLRAGAGSAAPASPSA